MSEKNLYLRGDTWWLSASVRGVLYRRSLHTGDVKVARKARDKIIEQIKAAKWRGEITVTWKDAVAEWATHEAGQIGEKTALRYAVSLAQAEPFFRTLMIEEITGNHIAEFIAIRRKGLATPSTIKNDLTAISRVLSYAEAMGWREGNPAPLKRKLLRFKRIPIVLPKHEEINLILQEASKCFRPLIEAAWLTGCRQNELVLAKWDCFNAQAGTLEIIGKGNKRRVITLSPMARSLIVGLPKNGDYIFPKADGTPFRMASSDFSHTRRAVKAKMAKESRPFTGHRFHDLRHLYAVEALRSGKSVYQLQKHLGHSSIQVTEMYLEFLSPEEQLAAKNSSYAQN
jgi:integrase/recombinase XerD